MKITLGAAVCLAIAVINLIFRGGPNTPALLPLITNGILLGVSVYLIIKGMAYSEAATTQITALNEQLAQKPALPAEPDVVVKTAREVQAQPKGARESRGIEPQAAPPVGAGAAINRSRQLEAELASANRRLADLDAKHKDALERREALEVALQATEAKLAEKAAAPKIDPGEVAVVNFLSLLQAKGRFVDFLMDDITPYDDRQVGAAARIVHQGCRDVLSETFDISPLREDGEGTAVTVGKDEPAGKYRLVGRVVGQPPFHGTLLHRGWIARKVRLPRPLETGEGEPTALIPRDVIQPAEIELR